MPACESAEELARHINATEARIRAAVPIARVIYLEPDIYSSPPSAAGTGTAAPTAAAPSPSESGEVAGRAGG